MAKVAKPVAPDHLTMALFTRGMTALHRAGLGGLACTLKALERQHVNGLLRSDKLPGPAPNGVYPWDITADSVTLKFGKPEYAGDYLKKLFAFGFAITKSGLIYLPGQHHKQPSDAILADLQRGLTLTFLQHGLVRVLAKEVTTVGYALGGDDVPSLVVEYKKCSELITEGSLASLPKSFKPTRFARSRATRRRRVGSSLQSRSGVSTSRLAKSSPAS